MAAFVTRLQPRWLPIQAARQLPEQSTTLRVAPTATGDTRIQGALHSITSDRFVRSLLCYFGQVQLLPALIVGFGLPDVVPAPMMAANSSSDIAFNSAFNSGCTDGQSQTGRR